MGFQKLLILQHISEVPIKWYWKIQSFRQTTDKHIDAQKGELELYWPWSPEQKPLRGLSDPRPQDFLARWWYKSAKKSSLLICLATTASRSRSESLSTSLNLKVEGFAMFYFNIKVSLTHLMHSFCSNPLQCTAWQECSSPPQLSPPVHSSLGLSTDIAILDVGTCTAEIPSAIQGCQQGKKYYR